MKGFGKRFLAFVLAFVLTTSVWTPSAFADTAPAEEAVVEEAKEQTPEETKAAAEPEQKQEEAAKPAPEEKQEKAEEAPELTVVEVEIPEAVETSEAPAEEKADVEETDPETAPEKADGEEMTEVQETETEAVDEPEDVTGDEEKDPSEDPAAPAEETEETKAEPKSFIGYVGRMTVIVKDNDGALPEGTKMRLAPVEAKEVEGVVNDTIEGEAKMIHAVDISFINDGVEIEPDGPVSVEFKIRDTADDVKNVQVLHIDDNNKVETMEDASVAQAKGKITAEFETDGFSIYVVVESVVPRLTVNFKNGSTDIASMIIKKADTDDELKTIIYDPGTGDDADPDQVFKGWTTDETYTAGTSKLLSIAQVRSDAKSKVAALTDKDDSVTYYAVFYKHYTITYTDPQDINIGTDTVELYTGDTNADYIINKGYSTDDKHNFIGWSVSEGEGNIVSSSAEPSQETIGEETVSYYPNNTELVIKGDVQFKVVAPEGYWLIFEENGKGASYNAPRFVKSGEVTSDAGLTTVRKGYSFVDWYTEAPAETGEDPAGTVFEFGKELSKTTTVYAKWQPQDTANYTVIFWTQNLDRSGYEVAASYVGKDAAVGENIPYTSVDNGDEDYVTGFGDGVGHFTGFNLKEDSKNQTVKVRPEGDSVLNLYYDRIEYNFKFYLYRDANQNGRYDYANNSGSGSTLDSLVTWHSNQTECPDTVYDIKSESVGGRTYHYFVMNAYYGEDISAKWPTYDKITGANNREAVSYVMMVGTKLKPTATNQGSGTVKGIITVLNENILGATNDANGNYVVIRFPDNYYNWRYHIWFETIEGEDYSGKETHEYNGKTYYEDTVLVVRSSNTEVNNQNEPKYTGFDFKIKRGENWNDGRYWNEDGADGSEYHLNFVYDRQQFKISYFDGNYVNGEDNVIQNKAKTLLHESAQIGQGAKIADEYKNYKPDAPEAGYVFEGWYLDEGCTVEYKWNTMPVGGIIVYAKWRQIEYRVFLHPNAGGGASAEPKDETLDWGSDSQKMSFRVAYGEKISAPTGLREGYEFYGWYTDEGCSKAFAGATKLTESTVKDHYDKENHMTDPMDKWGNGATTNQDADRWWVTKELNLYAKWSEVTIGAPGIKVIYDDGDGTNAPVDNSFYKDNTDVSAGSAATAPEGKVFDHWVLQKWNGSEFADTSTELLPGKTFTIKKGDAKITEAGTETVVDPSKVDKNKKYDYTVQLKAVYAELEEKTPTHIAWYSNYGSENGGKGELYRYDTLEGGEDVLGINEAVDILEAQTRAGFEFMGWTKTKGGTTADFLEWDKEAGVYKDASNGKTAEQVAADQKTPIEDLFAVWKEEEVEINYAVADDSKDFAGVSVDPETETVKASTGTAKGSTAKSTTTKYVFDYWTCDNGTEKVGETAKFVPEKNADGLYEAHTYYAHFKLNEADVVVHHYLKGTTTKVADDVTESATITEEYTASEAKTFYDDYAGKTLTADSYVPKQTITVAENGNEITVYYTMQLTIEAKNSSKKYDGKPLAGEYTITGALSADEEGIRSALGTAPSITDAGKKDYLTAEDQAKITGIPAYYVVTYTPGTLEITKRSVTMTSGDAEKVYDGKALTKDEVKETGDGFAEGEGATYDVTGTITDPGTAENTFTYTLKSGTKADNYEITKVEGKLTVKKNEKEIVITADSDSKTYDGKALTKNTYTFTEGILADGDELTAVVEGTITDVGTAKNVVKSYKVMRGTTEVTANYTFGKSVDGTLEVTKRKVTMTSGNAEKIYDGKALTKDEVKETGDGFVEGEGATYDVTGTITDPGTAENTFTYTLKSGTKADNYEITKVEGKLTVKKITDKTIVITADSDSKVYDGTALTKSTYTFTEGILADGDELTAVVEGTITDVGTAANKVTSYKVMRGTTEVTANYTFGESVDGELEVTPAPLKIKTGSAEKEFDGTALTKDEATSEGLVNSETVTLKATGSQTKVGESKNTYEITWGSAKKDNYKITEELGTLKVKKNTAEVKLTAASETKVYDGKALTNEEVKAEGLPEGFTVEAKAEGTQTDVGESTNKVPDKFVIKDADGNDQTASFENVKKVDGKLTVTKAKAKITTGSATKEYDGTPLTKDDAKIEGLVEGETVTLTTTGSQTEVGHSTNTYSIDWGTTKKDNYNVTEELGTLTVEKNPAEIKLTAASDSKAYDGKALTKDEVTAEGLPKGFTAEAKAEGSQTNVGKSANKVADGYVIKNADGQDKTANFTNVTKVDGELEVTPLEVTVTITGNKETKEYNGKEQQAEGYKTEISDPMYTEKDFTFDGEAVAKGTDVGTYPMGLDQDQFTNTNDNFTVTFTVIDGQLEITPYEGEVVVKITGNTAEETYDGTEKTAEGYEVEIEDESGAYKEEDFEFTGEAKVSATNAGEYEMGLAEDQFANINENFTNVTFEVEDGKLTIDKAPLKIFVDDKTVDYNGSEQYGEEEVQYEGLMAGQIATVTYTPSYGTEKGTYDNGEFGDDLMITAGAAPQSGAGIRGVKLDEADTSSENLADNYDVTYVTGKLTINRSENNDKAHLTVTKTCTSKPKDNKGYTVGETITWKVTVKNDGDVKITDIKVIDELTGDTWTVKSLEPGEEKAFSTSYTVKEKDAEAGKVVNEATAKGKDPNGKDPDVTPGRDEQKVVPTNPKTGDGTNMWLWTILLAASTISMAAIMLTMKKCYAYED